MKRLVIAITAASLLFGTAAMAAPYQARGDAIVTHRAVTTQVDYRGHDFRKGDRLSTEYRRGPAIDWRAHHLRQPPRGYYWVRAHNDFVLVARSNGLILDLAFAR